MTRRIRRNALVAALLPAGAAVNVVGCSDGWHWCDVVAGFNRGWVYSRFLACTFRNQPTVILQGGPLLGIPMINWSIGPYWDAHYRNRPWWNQRSVWVNRPPPRRPTPRPSP